jgi:hypothetical protein
MRSSCSRILRSVSRVLSRTQREVERLPRLRYLLLPVGRTLEDVDIYGLAEDGREIFAQVTYLSRESKPAQEKIEKLNGYSSGDAHLVFFGSGSGQRQEKGVVFVSVDEVSRWIDDDPDYRAALFPNS